MDESNFSFAEQMQELHCATIIWRIGEIFGEVGVVIKDPRYSHADAAVRAGVSKWAMRVATEDGQTVHDMEVPSTSSFAKVVKLRPATVYTCQTRVFCGAWGPWSPIIRTRTFAAVAASVTDVGVDYARFAWDRAVRDTTGLAVERAPESMEAVVQLANFELRVVREGSMQEEFSRDFPPGVRSHVLHNLQPGTAYIVFIRYATLVGTMRQWIEACRFATQSPFVLVPSSVGEVAITVAWARDDGQRWPTAYITADDRVDEFEITVEGRDAPAAAVRLPATATSFSTTQLRPGTEYNFTLRCRGVDGRWCLGHRPLRVSTLAANVASVDVVGETWADITWSRLRGSGPDGATAAEILVHAVGSDATDRTLATAISSDAPRVAVIRGLRPETQYTASVRTCINGTWGMWSAAAPFTTHATPRCQFTERGEDFITLSWDAAVPAAAWILQLDAVGAGGVATRVLDREVFPENGACRIDGLTPDTAYHARIHRLERRHGNGEEFTGEPSAVSVTRTLRAVDLQLVDIGEDFAECAWSRGLSRADGAERQWLDMRYEVVLACNATGEDRVEQLELSNTSHRLGPLQPNTHYTVSVRACDDKGQWGKWRSMTFRTLSSLTLTPHEIGENYVRILWARTDAADQETAAPDVFVSRYRIYVFSHDDDSAAVQCPATGYPKGGNSAVRIVRCLGAQHASVKLSDLEADRMYTAVISAATASGEWGPWSREVYFRTVAPLRVVPGLLNVGENYIGLTWDRDTRPVVAPGVVTGDPTTTSQQVHVRGVGVAFEKELTLSADQRHLRLYGLQPSSLYEVKLRACNRHGHWGNWSAPTRVLTRATIIAQAAEVAEDYVVVKWDKTAHPTSSNQAAVTGKGLVTSFHLRVSTDSGRVHFETYLTEGECPYRVRDLRPDSLYCIDIKAHYNDEEWGLWSEPLWCLTMSQLDVTTSLIAENFCNLTIQRPVQEKRLPQDSTVMSFGRKRPQYQLCVSVPLAAGAPASNAAMPRPTRDKVPPWCVDDRVVCHTEIHDDSELLRFTVPGLKPATTYAVGVRSRLPDGEWGMWSARQVFATLTPLVVGFSAVGEDFITVTWERTAAASSHLGGDVQHGPGSIGRSRLKIRDATGTFSRVVDVNSPSTTWTVTHLRPASTYTVSVQTFNDNHDWGMWSAECPVRTLPGIEVVVERVGEDVACITWARHTDLVAEITSSTALSAETGVGSYDLHVRGRDGFHIQREVSGSRCFLRGLVPDEAYEVRVRGAARDGRWGLWASQWFRTLPPMRVTFGNIGEHFAVVDWRRHLPAPRDVPMPIADPEDEVDMFRLRLQAGAARPTVFELPATISSFRLQALRPSSEYRVWLCARGPEGVWGAWSAETRLRTLPPLLVDIQDIGEDYVRVSWRRAKAEFPERAVGVDTWEIDCAVTTYEVQVVAADGTIVERKLLPFSQSSCVLSGLEPSGLYNVRVQSEDPNKDRGLWSADRRFQTLDRITAQLLCVGESFAHLSWERIQEAEGGAGGTLRSERAVQKWHVRLYSSRLFGGLPGSSDFVEHFHDGAVERMRIDGLMPGVAYTAAVRGMNSKGEWGKWSNHVQFDTAPRLAVEATYVGEDFIDVAWERLLDAPVLTAFPAASAPRQFQVTVTVTGPTEEQEEPRVFQTALNAQRIERLLPGTQYSVVVRERFRDEAALEMPGEYGEPSESLAIETARAMGVTVLEAGETYCCIQWQRIGEAPLTTRAWTTITAYEIQCFEASTVATTEPRYFYKERLPGSKSAAVLPQLLPHTAYTVRVRAQTDQRHWGLWSSEVRFITVPRLCLRVAAATDTSATLEWTRPMSATVTVPAAPDSESTPAVEDPTAHCIAQPPLQMDAFEVSVAAVGGASGFEITRALDAAATSVLISGLTPGALFTATVRGRSAMGHTSLWSRGATFCTLSELRIAVEWSTEIGVMVRWGRQQQAQADHAAALAAHLSTLQAANAAAAASHQAVVAELTAGASATEPLEAAESRQRAIDAARWNLRLLALDAIEVPPTLAPEALVMGADVATAYHIAVLGEDGGPRFVHGTNVLSQRDSRTQDLTCDSLRCLIDVAYTAAARTCTVRDLDVGRRYAVLLRCDATDGSWCEWLGPCEVALAAPYGLHVDGASNHFANLSWRRERAAPAHAKAAIGYLLRFVRRDGVVTEMELEAGCGVTTAYSLEPNATYAALICPRYDGGDWGAWSQVQRFSTTPRASLRVTYLNDTYVDVAWADDDAPVAPDARFEVRVCGEDYESVREAHGRARLRVGDLLAGTRYQIAVRMWSSRGGWGLWGELLVVTTLAELRTSVVDAGEDWLELTWCRADALHENAPAPGVGYYVRIRQDDGAPPPPQAHMPPAYDGAVIPPRPAPEVEETSAPFSRIFRVDGPEPRTVVRGLSPNSVYRVQVMCETEGAHVGAWSPELVAVTHRVVEMSPTLLGEEVAHVAWCRRLPDVTATSDGVPVIHIPYVCTKYTVLVTGDDGRYDRAHDLASDATSFVIDGLRMGACYSARVRSYDTQGRPSHLSAPLAFATQTPLVITPTCIAESTVWVGWTRAPLLHTPDADTVLPQERSTEFEVEATYLDADAPVFDQTVAGSELSLAVDGLRPNTPVSVRVRGRNPVGDWGQWSDRRIAYTMRALHTTLVASGEEWVVVGWSRGAPDVRDGAEMLDAPMLHNATSDSSDPPLVYCSAQSQIEAFTVEVRERDSGAVVKAIRADGIAAQCSVPGLRQTSTYDVVVRAEYQCGSGAWSTALEAATKSQLSLSITRIGEDHLATEWTRAASLASTGAEEETVALQLRVRGVPGEVCCDCITVESAYTVEGLSTGQRYALTLRRWFKPVVPPAPEVLAAAAMERAEIQALAPGIDLTAAVPGPWTDTLSATTLAGMQVRVVDIAEDALHVRWARDADPATPSLFGSPQAYELMLDEMTADGGAVADEDGSVHFVQEFQPVDSELRMTDLRAGAVYQLRARCRADGVWGLWSAPCTIAMPPRIQVQLQGVGEDYAVVTWERAAHALALPDGSSAVAGVMAPAELHQIEVFGVERPYHLERKVRMPLRSFRLNRLEPHTRYTVALRSCDARGEWSLWSERITVTTLQPLRLTPVAVGEQFVRLQWRRPGLEAPRPPTGYHLCLFDAPDSPSAATSAVHDMQLGGDVTEYTVPGLEPNRRYIAVVRCRDADGEWGLWSEEVRVATVPHLVLRVVSAGETSLRVAWTREAATGTIASSPPVQYRIAVSTAGGAGAVVAERVVPSDGAAEALVTGLPPDTRLLVAVQAGYEGGDWGLWTKPTPFTTAGRLGLIVGHVTEGGVEATWGCAYLGADSSASVRPAIAAYELEVRRVGAQSPEDEVAFTQTLTAVVGKAAPSFSSVTGLLPGARYEARVRARNSDGVWGEWGAATFETLPAPPSAPELRRVGPSTVVMTWVAPPIPGRYEYSVERQMEIAAPPPGRPTAAVRAPEVSDWRVVDTTEATQLRFRVESGIPLASVRCRVRCRLARGSGPAQPAHAAPQWSRYTAVATLVVSAPAPVAGLQVDDVTTTTAVLSWSPPTGTDGVAFRVFLAARDQPAVLVAATRACRCELTELLAGTAYRVQVQVEGGGGASERNPIVKFATLADDDAPFAATGPTMQAAAVPRKPSEAAALSARRPSTAAALSPRPPAATARAPAASARPQSSVVRK